MSVTTPETNPSPPPSPRVQGEGVAPRARFTLPVSDEVAYLLPMGVFLALIWVGGNWPELYAPAYVARAVIVAILLYLLWPKFTKIRWTHLGWGVAVGVLGIVQWIAMQAGLEAVAPEWFKPKDPFNPFEAIATPWMLYAWIAVRWATAFLVVPVMEELFWRDYLWRRILAPNDFKLADVGEWDWSAYLIVSGAFALVHGAWWPTAIVYGLIIGALLVKTKSLGACIVAHGVSNLLLGAYVLWTKNWGLW